MEQGGHGEVGSGAAGGAAALLELIGGLPEELRLEAVTHSSWTEGRPGSYERLAFLGDSVLGLAVAEELCRRFPEVSAGRLSQIANQSVSAAACAEVGRALGVAEMLLASEPDSPADRTTAASLLASDRPVPEVTEALIGACCVEYGYEGTAPAVVDAFTWRMELAAETRLDFKSALQERLAQHGAKVDYRVVSESGPAHKRSFEVEAVVDGKVVGEGSGRSKKAAEQVAARQALERLGG